MFAAVHVMQAPCSPIATVFACTPLQPSVRIDSIPYTQVELRKIQHAKPDHGQLVPPPPPPAAEKDGDSEQTHLI